MSVGQANAVPHTAKVSACLLQALRLRFGRMDIREKLLHAAMRVYSETGYRGATTRRIAIEAGVNEITLFRHFGSKDALIHAALSHSKAVASAGMVLPEEPLDPERELTAWCLAISAHLTASRSVVRKVLGEIEEHPDIALHASACPSAAASQLAGYLERLHARGMARADVDPLTTSAMLMGALFADAMSRDCVPALFPGDPETMVAGFVRLCLRGIGALPVDAAAPSTSRAHS